MRVTMLGYHTDQGPYGHHQYDGQGEYMYCDMSTASEVFLIFTTQLYLVYAILMQ